MVCVVEALMIGCYLPSLLPSSGSRVSQILLFSSLAGGLPCPPPSRIPTGRVPAGGGTNPPSPLHTHHYWTSQSACCFRRLPGLVDVASGLDLSVSGVRCRVPKSTSTRQQNMGNHEVDSHLASGVLPADRVFPDEKRKKGDENGRPIVGRHD